MVSSDIRLNVLLHVWHEYFFTSEWVCRCARKFDRSANARLQCWHENGFSPVCVRMWPCNSHGRLNALPHSLHKHGRVCVRMCILSAPSVLYALSQYLQQNVLGAAAAADDAPSFSEQWYCWCLVSPDTVEYVFVQDGHLYRVALAGGDETIGLGLNTPDSTLTTDAEDDPASLSPTGLQCCCIWYNGGCGESRIAAGGGGKGGDCNMINGCPLYDCGDRPSTLPRPYHGDMAAGGLCDGAVEGDECSGLNAEPAPEPGGDGDASQEEPVSIMVVKPPCG